MEKIWKRVAGILLMALLLCGSFVSDRVYASDDDFTIENHILTKYTGDGGNVDIPDGVTGIGSGAFLNCTGLISVRIPNGVQKIGEAAFRGCTGLTNAVVPDSVSEIDANAFRECPNLTGIELPSSLTRIGGRAFRGCTSLENITIPDGIQKIEIGLFYECSNLKKADLPDSLVCIGDHAFQRCTSLEQIVIPEQVTDIGGAAFIETPWLEKKRNESDAGFVIINNILVDQAKVKGAVVIPDTVKKIAQWASYQCEGLTDIVISDSVTEIGDEAFAGCKNLQKARISNHVTQMGAAVFQNCIQLTDLSLPNGLTEIPDHLCCGCSSLKSITIPENVTSIGYGAFYECKSLTAVKIPDAVTVLEQHVFNKCTALSDIDIPAGITEIGGGALYDTVWMSRQREQGSNSLVIVNDILIDGRKAVGNVQIPDTVKKIAGWTFYGNKDITGVTLGNITEIEYGAFWKCTNLTDVTIPDSTTKIGDTAFAKTGLQTINFPKNVKEIGCGAILGCPNLEKVTIENEAADVIKKDDGSQPNIFGVRGGSDEAKDVKKEVTFKDKKMTITGHQGSTAYELADHIRTYKEDYGYQEVSFTEIENSKSGTQQSGEVSADGKELLKKVRVTSALHIRKGRNGQIKVTLPAGLIKTDKFTGESGQVKVTYKIRSSKIATVDENGRVAGKRKGSAQITTTIRLQDGTSEVFRTKVTVK